MFYYFVSYAFESYKSSGQGNAQLPRTLRSVVTDYRHRSLVHFGRYGAPQAGGNSPTAKGWRLGYEPRGGDADACSAHSRHIK